MKKKANIIIAIDGQSSCGKSTLAKQLSKILDYTYVDSGAMYRAVTLYFLENTIDISNNDAVASALEKISISFQKKSGNNITLLNGKDVELEIRKMYVSDMVSQVAAISAVRRALVRQQQRMGRLKGIVMDGRDIGTVVFPKAELKLFITANIEIRTNRRYLELKEKGLSIPIEEIRENIKNRDNIDSTRIDSPLKQAKDAVLIDNSNLSREEQLTMISALANYRIACKKDLEVVI